MLISGRNAVRRASMLPQNAVTVAVRQTIRKFAKSAAATPPGERTFNTELLAFLVCPLSKGELRYDADKQELVSHEIGVAYRIVAGIPRLIPTAGRLVDTATSGRNE